MTTYPHRRSILAASLAAVSSLAAQRGGNPPLTPPTQQNPDDVKLPSGKSQRDEILKADRERNLKDAADLLELAQQLQQDIEKNDAFVFSLTTLKKTDDIEKLAKKIRTRMRRN